MQNSLRNFTDIFELNVFKSQLSKNLIILYTEEYESLALSAFHSLKPSYSVSLKKLESIFEKNLENFILEKDIFLLFYTLPWHELKNYYAQVRPVLMRYSDRSYVIRDCLQHFNEIYSIPFSEIDQLNKTLCQLGENTRKVVIKNSLGTELEFIFEQKSPWRSIDGTNVPNELVPSEVSNYTPVVNGRVVFTGAIVSLVPIGKKYGLIQDPVTFTIENGLIQEINCQDKALENDLVKIFHHCEGNREIVELGIGTNRMINLLGISAPFEERKAGFHLGTGGYQAKSQHIDFIFSEAEIYFDELCVFSKNQFVEN